MEEEQFAAFKLFLGKTKGPLTNPPKSRRDPQSSGCDKMKMVPPNMHLSESLAPIDMLSYVTKRILQVWLNEGSWDGEIILIIEKGFGRGLTQESLQEGGQRGRVREKWQQKQRLEWCALNMEVKATGWPLEAGKCELPEETQLCQHLDFSPKEPFPSSDL